MTNKDGVGDERIPADVRTVLGMLRTEAATLDLIASTVTNHAFAERALIAAANVLKQAADQERARLVG